MELNIPTDAELAQLDVEGVAARFRAIQLAAQTAYNAQTTRTNASLRVNEQLSQTCRELRENIDNHEVTIQELRANVPEPAAIPQERLLTANDRAMQVRPEKYMGPMVEGFTIWRKGFEN